MNLHFCTIPNPAHPLQLTPMPTHTPLPARHQSCSPPSHCAHRCDRQILHGLQLSTVPNPPRLHNYTSTNAKIHRFTSFLPSCHLPNMVILSPTLLATSHLLDLPPLPLLIPIQLALSSSHSLSILLFPSLLHSLLPTLFTLYTFFLQT